MAYSNSISQLENMLEHLQSLANRMKNSSGIHQIDIDLLQQKTRELYEYILMLKPVSEAEPEAESKPESEPESESLPEPKPEMETSGVNSGESEKENIQEEAYKEDSVENMDEGTVAVESEISQTKTTLDLFSGTGDESLGAVLSQQATQTNLGEKLEQAPVNDLREAIGINDKFQFINELFNGDMDQYNKVLDELNSFSSLQGALTYLSELSVQYDFQKTGMAFQRLKALLNKKYA